MEQLEWCFFWPSHNQQGLYFHGRVCFSTGCPQILGWPLLVVLVSSFPRVEPRGRCAQCPVPRSHSVVPIVAKPAVSSFPLSSKVSAHSFGSSWSGFPQLFAVSVPSPITSNGDNHNLHLRRLASTFHIYCLSCQQFSSNHGRQLTSPTSTGGCPFLPLLHHISLRQPSRLGLLLPKWKSRGRNVGMPKGR